MVDPGNILHASDQGAIAILTQTEPITVTFTLPAQNLDDVRDAAARGTVEVAAYDRNNTRLLSTGTLTTIDNLIDPTTATFRLKATFKNDDEKLWPGEFVNARLLVDTRKDVVVIPPLAVTARTARAVRLGGEGGRHRRAAPDPDQRHDGRPHHRQLGRQ